MARTIVALYDDLSLAHHVIRDLNQAGIPREHISLVANDAAREYAAYLQGTRPVEHVGPGEGATFGATVGALTGALVALGTALIPGVGPVIAAGPLVSTLTGAVTGAIAGGATGGIVGALLELGMPEAEANLYAEGVRRGGSLITVHAANNDEAKRAEQTMNRHNPVDMERRAALWREIGWKHFNPADQPYTASQVARNRAAYRNLDAQAETQPSRSNLNYTRSYDSPDKAARV